MSTTTQNFGLVKPELSDAADITAMNPNWDTIDTELDKIDGKQDTITGALTPYLTNPGTANRAVTFDASGKLAASLVTKAELEALRGVSFGIQSQIDAKEKKAVIGTHTLRASGWSNGKYNALEVNYPNANIEISPNPSNEEQLNAFANAKLVGSASSNVITAMGVVPTIDIPIIMKLTDRG